VLQGSEWSEVLFPIKNGRSVLESSAVKRVLLLALCLPGILVAQQSQQLWVVWDERIWQLPMIQKRYPDWPQTSVLKVEVINAGQIDLIPWHGERKHVFLRQDQSPATFLRDPNLLKPVLFGMRPDNSVVDIRYPGRSARPRVTTPRIKGALDPNYDYLSEGRKY
jgi:hypothetical protein